MNTSIIIPLKRWNRIVFLFLESAWAFNLLLNTVTLKADTMSGGNLLYRNALWYSNVDL